MLVIVTLGFLVFLMGLLIWFLEGLGRYEINERNSSGIYTTPANVLDLRVRMVGAQAEVEEEK
jgi:hypothetical protein